MPGLRFYQQVMKASREGSIQVQPAVPCQAVGLLGTHWGVNKYETKRTLLKGMLEDFHRLCAKHKTPPQLLQDHCQEDLYSGIIKAYYVEHTEEAYSEALVTMIDIAKSMRRRRGTGIK